MTPSRPRAPSIPALLLATALAGCAPRTAPAAPPDDASATVVTPGPVMRARRPPPRGPDAAITPAQRTATIDALLATLSAKYVFPDLATRAGKAVRARHKRGEYESITTGHALAIALTDHINEVLRDAHFGVNFSATQLPARAEMHKPGAEELAEYASVERNVNGGFEKVERLPGNIGYIEVRSFAFARRGFHAAAAAMAFIADTDALIIDLRRNGGGDPDMVAALSSWLFAEPTHLNDLYWREGDVTRQYWTLPGVPGARYLDRDVFVLTSERTGSGAEEFAYNLKQLKRATLVGEVTWGGANPGDVFRLGDHFDAFIPTGKAINPISKTNWEGTGVAPDIAVPADDALRVAQVELLKRRLAATTHPEQRQGLEQRLQELTKAP
jgi:hypothetical protein